MEKRLVGMDGLYPALITPFDTRGAVDTTVLTDLMSRNLAEGAAGFFVGGSSAECFLLSHEERVLGYQVAAAFRGRARLIAHVGALSTQQAVQLGQEAARLGFDALAATPPFYFRHSPAAIVGYYRDLAAATGMPVMLYNYPANTGVAFDFSLPLFAELLRMPQMAGFKHTNYDLRQLQQMLTINPRLVALNGYEDVLPGAVALGATGAIGSTFNCFLPFWKKVFDDAVAGRVAQAQAGAARGAQLIAEISAGGLIAAIKYVLQKQGLAAGDPRKPFLPLDAAARERIDRALTELAP